MGAVIGPILLGLIILVLGLSNRKGNISSVHWYHRTRVTEENRLPFGRMIGLGTVIIGAAVMVYGGLAFVSIQTGLYFFILIGGVIVTLGCIVGLGLSLYAMFKYNKGIF